MKLLFLAVFMAVAISGILAAPAPDPDEEFDNDHLMDPEEVHAYLGILDRIPGARTLINKIKPFLKANKAILKAAGKSMAAKVKELTSAAMSKFPDIAAKVGAVGAKALVQAALPLIMATIG